MNATCTPMANTVVGMRKGSTVAKRNASRPKKRWCASARAAKDATSVESAATASAMRCV